MDNQLMQAVGGLLTYTWEEMLINMVLAAVLGFVVSGAYRYTHTGLSYSQSFTQTILFVALIVAIVMMVIGSSLARAFALVGALSIIRFRTVVKDTKDTAYIFGALAVGMAAGTSNYFLAVAATAVIVGLAVVLHRLNYGALYKSEFILRFTFERDRDSQAYVARIAEFSKRSSLLHLEPSGDGSRLKVTYDVTLKPDLTAEDFTRAISGLDGVSEVVLIAAKSDVDY